MLSTLPNLSTTLVKLGQKVNGFLVTNIDSQSVPTNNGTTLTNWTITPSMLTLIDNGFGLWQGASSSLNLTNGVFTAPVTGTYVMSATVSGTASSVGPVTATIMAPNFIGTDKRTVTASEVGNEFTLSPSATGELFQGDTVCLDVFQTTGTSFIVGLTFFSIFLKQKSGQAGAINGAAVVPVSKPLTNFAKTPVGFSASIASRALSGGPTLINWSVTGPGDFNAGGNFNPTNGLFTVPVGGYYHLTATVNLTASSNIQGELAVCYTVSDNMGDSSPLLNLIALVAGGQKVSVKIPGFLVFINQKPKSPVSLVTVGLDYVSNAGVNVFISAKWSMILHERTE